MSARDWSSLVGTDVVVQFVGGGEMTALLREVTPRHLVVRPLDRRHPIRLRRSLVADLVPLNPSPETTP